jgi:hypothetical protein
MKKLISKTQIVLLTLVFMLVLPISSYAVDGQRKISQTPSTTFPITISQSGSYVLTSNLSVTDPNVNAIEITVNDVTLDLNGHTIQGPNTGTGYGSGIYALDRYSITIKNGRIWGFGQNGIYLDFTDDPSKKGAGHIIKEIQALNNRGDGMLAPVAIITNCTANNNGTTGNSVAGITGINSTIVNCTASNNRCNGINAVSSTVVNCTANYNQDYGIECISSTITNCMLYNNEDAGIRSENFSRIEGNNMSYNTGYGLILGSYGNYVIKNVASWNSSGGFFDFSPIGSNYMPVTIHNPPASECSGNDNCEFLPLPAP